MADFARLMVQRDVWIFEHYGLTREKNWLCFSPGGPRGAFEQAKRGARAWGVLPFGIDMDPRWVKKQIEAGHQKEADACAEHLLDQAMYILRNQNIGYIRLTPPILARIVRRDDMVDASCYVSAGAVGPTLTIMALTARAWGTPVMVSAPVISSVTCTPRRMSSRSPTAAATAYSTTGRRPVTIMNRSSPSRGALDCRISG
jgi:hypothetical protein